MQSRSPLSTIPLTETFLNLYSGSTYSGGTCSGSTCSGNTCSGNTCSANKGSRNPESTHSESLGTESMHNAFINAAPENIASLQRIDDPVLAQAGVTLAVLRLDLLFPQYSGNKYFKLKYNIVQARVQGCKRLLSFGGAFSNHIHALAFAGAAEGFDTVGIIRGERPKVLNDTLIDAQNAGMTLHYVSRDEYRMRHDSQYQQDLLAQYPDCYIIPEGGANLLGVRGCMEIVEHIHRSMGSDYDVIALPCGTGATMAGVVAGVVAGTPDDKTIIGVSVLKGANYLDDEVSGYLRALNVDDNTSAVDPSKSAGAEAGPAVGLCRWRIEHDYHCGGYAKLTPELVRFMDDFQQRTEIPLEPVYSAKMLRAIYAMITDGQMPDNARIVAIHTGGLQGLRGMQERLDKLRANT